MADFLQKKKNICNSEYWGFFLFVFNLKKGILPADVEKIMQTPASVRILGCIYLRHLGISAACLLCLSKINERHVTSTYALPQEPWEPGYISPCSLLSKQQNLFTV